MLKWLLGGKEQAGGAPQNRVDVRALGVGNSDLVSVRELDFFGHCNRSPNGRYALLWRDGNGSTGGARSSGLGRYYLLDGDRVAVAGEMERPNDGKVADSGTFILNDWRFTSVLAGTFYAFRADGTEIIARPFAANLYNNGLAPDGRLAACQTANAPSPDGSRLTIFDLEYGIETGGCVPESGWGNSYEFPSGDRVRLVHRDLGAFDYALDGTFIDRDGWIDASLRKGVPHLIQNMLREAGENPPPTLLGRLLKATDIALYNPDYKDGRWQASILKTRGTCLDRLGRTQEALDTYDRALKLDPKIGLKKRAEALRKQLAAK